MEIPKTIHYCWFGRGKQPHLIRKCIKSWKKFMPDYTLKCWNEDNFDVSKIPFVYQAYKEKKWAFVADYVRFYALYNEGGIYMDTDVQIFQSFNPFRNHSFFAGTEVRYSNKKAFTTIDVSVFGCIPKHWYTAKCLEYYEDKPFRDAKGYITGKVVQCIATNIIEEYGYKREDVNQIIYPNVHIYSTRYFTNKENKYDTKTLFSLHHFDGSWNDDISHRGKIYKWARKKDLIHIYRILEQILTYLRNTNNNDRSN